MGDTEITCAAGTILGRTRGGVREFESVPYLAPAGAFDDPVPLEQGLLIDATVPHPRALSLITPTGARPGTDCPVVVWLCRRDHYAGEFRRVWAANPVFPRAPYEKRKWAARFLLSAPLTRDKLNELARDRPGRVARSYRRYAKAFGPVGPQPYDEAELADLAHVRVAPTLDAVEIARFAR